MCGRNNSNNNKASKSTGSDVADVLYFTGLVYDLGHPSYRGWVPHPALMELDKYLQRG